MNITAAEPHGSSSRYEPTAQERDSLQALRRGAFAVRDIPAGTRIGPQDVEFAFPPATGQVLDRAVKLPSPA